MIQSGRVNLRFGDANIAMVMRVTCLVAEGDVAVDVVLELDRPQIHIGLQIVAMLEAVVVAAFDRGRAIEQPGNAVVRSVVRAFAQVAEREPGRRAQSEGQRGSDAVAAVLGDVAPGKFRIVAHQVQPESSSASQRGQRPIDVGGDPLGLIRAQVDGPGEKRGRTAGPWFPD